MSACPACGYGNSDAARFCEQCGTPLVQAVTCPSCGALNATGQRFCGACGHRLGPKVSFAADPRAVVPVHLAEKIRTARSGLEGERKHVTVLFADVKESMDLAAALDPEDWRRIMSRFFSILCDGVHRFEGTVDKFTGDGIMALFGAPIAHEDHARRACYAALHLRDELDRYAAELRRARGLSFSVRMGLNSGEVVVGTIGDDLSLEYTAVGHTVGLAARMESLAEPGKAYLTAHTAALVGGYFDLDDLGEFEVKGVPRALRVYELAALGALRTTLQVAAMRGFSRFVGRDEELAALEEALERTIAGEAQLVAVVGEAGVGKSRLCFEFAQRCRARGVEVWQTHGLLHARAVPFVPVLEILRAYFGIGERDNERAAREKVAGRLLLLDESFREALPLIFDFLGVADPEHSLPWLDPEARQRQVFAAVNRMVRIGSQHRPGVVLIENLQWLDPGSEAFLENLVDGLPGIRGMLLVNFRPEYRARWTQQPLCRRLVLAPLGPTAIDLLLNDLLGADASLVGLAATIRERTGGNPFFIEEVVRTLAESGTLAGSRGAYRLVHSVGTMAIPPTVEAVLAARIDRLGEREKAVLQMAAVIGGQFSEPVLRHVSGLPEAALASTLRALVAAEFLSEQELYPEVEYAFRHALTEEVAYRSQLGSRRAEVHGAVARAIEELHPDRVDERAALLAQHWEAAGELEQAAHWNARAAVWARLKDPFEARRHWRKVLDLAPSLQETPEIVGVRIAAGWMLLNFGWRLGVTEGQEVGDFEREMAEVYAQTRALAERHERTEGVAVLAATYGAVRMLCGHPEESVELGREALALARRTGDHALHIAVLTPLVYALFVVGNVREALATTEEGLRLAGKERALGTAIAVVSPYAWLLLMRGLLEAWTGSLGSGRRGLEQALQVAAEDGDAETEAWSHMMLVLVGELADAPGGVLTHARQAVAIAERAAGAFSRGLAQQYLGIAHVARGEWADAVAAFEHALGLYRERDVGLEEEALTLAFLARAHLGHGDAAAARAAADEAVRLACGRGTKVWEMYARHERARALVAMGGPSAVAAAAQDIECALALAGKTGGRSFEPRLHRELAELARLRGDDATYERELREADRLFAEVAPRSPGLLSRPRSPTSPG
jgi:class 3 adenylate cyclase